MDTIKLFIGTKSTTHSGQPMDNMRPVEFEGEKLAEVTRLHSDDTRGTTETLYKTTDGRYVVYIEGWTKWQGETSNYQLKETTSGDLRTDGRFEELGREAGLGRPLTLDEALG